MHSQRKIQNCTLNSGRLDEFFEDVLVAHFRMKKDAEDVFLFVFYGLDAFCRFSEGFKVSAGSNRVIVEYVSFEVALKQWVFFESSDFCHSNLQAIQ